MAGYVVTVTPAGDVLPGDVWGWSQAASGGEKVVREVRRDRVVFTDDMSAPLLAMLKENGRWSLKSRVPVSRQEVDTLEDAQAYLSGLLEALLQWPKHKKESKLAATWLWLELPTSKLPSSTHALPDGSSITVKPAEDGGPDA